MSILIKGMEMPKNCTRCDHIGLNVAIGCPVMSGTDGRATDCPLVDLGKHGRLIDADALEPDADYDDGEFWAYSVAQVCSAPTVIEAKDGE